MQLLVETEHGKNARAECEIDEFFKKVGETTDGSHTDDKRDNAQAFPPCSIGQ